ncbi:MAG: hypothetical protein ACYDH5_19640 [Acidimicrobiales bacterium]
MTRISSRYPARDARFSRLGASFASSILRGAPSVLPTAPTCLQRRPRHPLGLVVAGIVADALGVRTTLMIGGAISAITIFIPLMPGLRDGSAPRASSAVTSVYRSGIVSC